MLFIQNAAIDKSELVIIRSLSVFDLVMLISEISDHGWLKARELLPLMTTQAVNANASERQSR